MPPDTSSSYASGPLQTLLQRELALLAPLLGGIYGVWGLHVRPHEHAPVTLPAHLLSAVVELALDDAGSCAGSLRCEPAQLPFASESFKLVVAQHVLEQVAMPDASAEELARVLAPEGVALMFGFNPVSLWRPWVSRRLRSGLQFALGGRVAPETRTGATRRSAGALCRSVGSMGRRRIRSPGEVRALARSRAIRRQLAVDRAQAAQHPDAVAPATARADLKLNPTLVPGAHRECA